MTSTAYGSRLPISPFEAGCRRGCARWTALRCLASLPCLLPAASRRPRLFAVRYLPAPHSSNTEPRSSRSRSRRPLCTRRRSTLDASGPSFSVRYASTVNVTGSGRLWKGLLALGSESAESIAPAFRIATALRPEVFNLASTVSSSTTNDDQQEQRRGVRGWDEGEGRRGWRSSRSLVLIDDRPARRSPRVSASVIGFRGSSASAPRFHFTLLSFVSAVGVVGVPPFSSVLRHTSRFASFRSVLVLSRSASLFEVSEPASLMLAGLAHDTRCEGWNAHLRTVTGSGKPGQVGDER